MIDYKTCTMCGLVKSIDQFPRTGKCYISNKCKKCISIYKRAHKNELIPFCMKKCVQCGILFKTRAAIVCKSCRSMKYGQGINIKTTRCRLCGQLFTTTTLRKKYCSKKCQQRMWYIQNPEDLESKKNRYEKWRDQNRDKISCRDQERYHTDIQYKLTKCLRSRLRHALKNGHKSGSAVKDLGCSIEEFKNYLESKFQEGMTWNNWDLYGWHIDHVQPLSSFDLQDPEELKKACHYTNLQPLWAKDNINKSDKYSDTI